jgi:hypothetical protein
MLAADCQRCKIAPVFGLAGVVSACCVVYGAYRWHRSVTKTLTDRFEKKLDKVLSQQQGSSNLPGGVLGLLSFHWLEALDPSHRYGSCLIPYWQRWEISDTRLDFFRWLDDDDGKHIDLPLPGGYPRRFLQEWKVWYLTKQEQLLFQVEIENGQFMWTSDRTPVTVPLPADHVPVLEREKFISVEMLKRQALTRKRNALLAVAKLLVEGAQRASLAERTLLKDVSSSWVLDVLETYVESGPEANGVAQIRYGADFRQTDLKEGTTLIDFIARPLVEEGLLRQLRDPVFKYRTEHQYRLPGSHLPDDYHNSKAEAIPLSVLPGAKWTDFLVALAHEQDSRIVGTAPPKGIFVVDSQGRIFAGTKLRGIFHHTSFVRAHGVLCAGSVVVRDGTLCKFSPHSGHYTPRASDVQRIVQDWAAKGVNIGAAEFKGYDKS